MVRMVCQEGMDRMRISVPGNKSKNSQGWVMIDGITALCIIVLCFPAAFSFFYGMNKAHIKVLQLIQEIVQTKNTNNEALNLYGK